MTTSGTSTGAAAASSGPPKLKIGVLALQGAFEEHAALLKSLNADVTQVYASKRVCFDAAALVPLQCCFCLI
jgi:hypothetical protein